MRYVKPDYFDAFRCRADQCSDTCCAGWQIVIDEESLGKYIKDKSAFGNRLCKGIDWREGSFVQHKGRCSMLNEQNLCDLVIEKGEDWLCETCSRYPRHVEEYEGLREWSLSLSCPVAAELMLNRKEPVTFLVKEDEEEDPLEEEFEDFDLLLFTQLEDARKVMLDVAQSRNLTIDQRKSIILELAGKMQDCIEEERLFDMDELIACYAAFGSGQGDRDGSFPEKEEAEVRYENLCKGFSYLEQMERLREEWSGVLDEAKETLYSGGYEKYRLIYEAFQKEFGPGGEKGKDWGIFQENLLVFFLYTYFCGAVYDDWIYSKAALCVFSVSFIQEFVMCRWFLADKSIDMQDWMELAYRYAREVEHSDENLNFLEECFNSEDT